MDKEAALEKVVSFLEDETSPDHIPDVDAIFAFGHVDPRIPRHVAHLYNLKKAKKIVITGKGRKEIPGYESEADYYAAILKEEGISETAIILEEEAMNTLENVRLGVEACEINMLHPRSLILVSVPALLRRSAATFAKQFPDITTYNSSFEMPLGEYEEKINLLLGEFDRLEEYAKKGDVDPIAIPDDVKEALRWLKH